MILWGENMQIRELINLFLTHLHFFTLLIISKLELHVPPLLFS